MDENKKRKKTSFPKHVIAAMILAAAFIASAAVLFVFCIILGIFPAVYLVIFAIIVLVLAYGILFANRWRAGGITANIISCLLIACFILASFYVQVTKSTIVNVQSTDYETVYMGVYVLDENEAEELEDLAGYEIGYDSILEEYAAGEALSYIEEALSGDLEITDYESMYEMIDDLEAGTVEAVVLSVSYKEVAEEIEEYEWIEDGLREIERIEVNIEKETQEEAEEDSDLGTFIIYISGIDSFGDVSVKSRSDVNILAVVNTETKNILLVTTPRDYYVTFEVTNGAYDKLTHAGIYGVDQSISAMEILYGVEVDYYIRMNFTGFENIIDALGGITVYSDVAFSSSVSDYSYTAGYNTLDGEAALYFARERKTFTDGDFQRGRNQMAVISAMLDKIVSFSTLANYQAVMNAIADSFETNMSTSTINSIIQMQLSYGGSWDLTSYQTTGNTGYAITYSAAGQYLSVVFQDEESISEAMELIDVCLSGGDVEAAAAAFEEDEEETE